MSRQVLIEVLVAEITLTDDTRLGIDWAVRQGRFNFANTNTGPPGLPTTPTSDGGTMTFPAGVAGPAAVLGPFGQGLTAFTFATDHFIAMLNALASDNKVNIVSNPHVMTSENKKAVINVSTSVPVVTSQTTGQVAAATTTTTTTTTTAGLNQTVEYRDASGQDRQRDAQGHARAGRRAAPLPSPADDRTAARLPPATAAREAARDAVGGPRSPRATRPRTSAGACRRRRRRPLDGRRRRSRGPARAPRPRAPRPDRCWPRDSAPACPGAAPAAGPPRSSRRALAWSRPGRRHARRD